VGLEKIRFEKLHNIPLYCKKSKLSIVMSGLEFSGLEH
jgi:hypothetical protein